MSRRLGAVLALLGGGLAQAIAAHVFVAERYVDLGEVNAEGETALGGLKRLLRVVRTG